MGVMIIWSVLYPAEDVCLLFVFVTPGAREGEDRPLGRCNIEQEKDEGTRGQPPLPADQYTGKGMQLTVISESILK